LQVPAWHVPAVPHVDPSGAFPDSTHTGAPVEHEMTALRHSVDDVHD
jgi:hypothetical protein